METEDSIPEFVSNDNIDSIVNSQTEPQGQKFNAVAWNKNDNLRLKRNLITLADVGLDLIQEIMGTLSSIEITATNILPNSRWSRFVIQGNPSTVGN